MCECLCVHLSVCLPVYLCPSVYVRRPPPGLWSVQDDSSSVIQDWTDPQTSTAVITPGQLLHVRFRGLTAGFPRSGRDRNLPLTPSPPHT